MKTNLPVLIAAAFLHAAHAPASQQSGATPMAPAPLPRHEMDAMTAAARGVEAFIRMTPHNGARVWPHAVRDGHGRAGLIIMAHRPLLMTLDMEDIDQRRSWILSTIIAAARQQELVQSPVDHLALTDPEGVRGPQWYYDVDMQLARRVLHGLRDGSLTATQAYLDVIRSWRLVTADHPIAAR